MHFMRLNTALTGHEENWSFIGVPRWNQNHKGVISPPVWSYPNFDPDPSMIPSYYAHELAREDYAFLTSQPLEHTDVSVDLRSPCGVDGHPEGGAYPLSSMSPWDGSALPPG
ncbi:MAG: hypothetical protein V1800_14645 [Candidatus Latescibacterota bacterium]